MGVPELNLIEALATARATFQGQVAAGSTADVVQLAGLDLGSSDLAGNLVLLASGALGAGAPAQVAVIQSNTHNTITLAAALGAAPAEGYGVAIYAAATIQQPVNKALVFNTSETANTNILGADITPGNAPSNLRIQVQVESAAKLNVMLTRGGVTKPLGMNQATALIAGGLFTFDVQWHAGDSVNFQVDTSVTVDTLTADEIDAAA